MKSIILYLPLFILIYSFYSLPINPGFPVIKFEYQVVTLYILSQWERLKVVLLIL